MLLKGCVKVNRNTLDNGWTISEAERIYRMSKREARAKKWEYPKTFKEWLSKLMTFGYTNLLSDRAIKKFAKLNNCQFAKVSDWGDDVYDYKKGQRLLVIGKAMEEELGEGVYMYRCYNFDLECEGGLTNQQFDIIK